MTDQDTQDQVLALRPLAEALAARYSARHRSERRQEAMAAITAAVQAGEDPEQAAMDALREFDLSKGVYLVGVENIDALAAPDAPADAPEVTVQHVDLRQIVKRLPERWRMLFTRHYLEGVSQTEVARELGVSRPAVTQTLRTVRARVRLLASLPDISPERMRHDLSALYRGQQLTALVAYWETHSQSEAGRRCGKPQSWVRQVVLRACRRLGRLQAYRRHAVGFARVVAFYAGTGER